MKNRISQVFGVTEFEWNTIKVGLLESIVIEGGAVADEVEGSQNATDHEGFESTSFIDEG